jgi:hypothetical protein
MSFPDALDRGAAQHDLQRDPRSQHDDSQDDDEDVLEQHTERDEHDAERRERVEAGERRCEEGACAPGDDEQPKDDVAQAVIEEEAQARPGEALEPADHLHQARDEALLAAACELQPLPALRQPDPRAARDQLGGEERGDDLEHVRGAAGRQRQRRDAEQDHEDDREALLLEKLDEAPEGLLALALQPAFELVADAVGLLHAVATIVVSGQPPLGSGALPSILADLAAVGCDVQVAGEAR